LLFYLKKPGIPGFFLSLFKLDIAGNNAGMAGPLSTAYIAAKHGGWTYKSCRAGIRRQEHTH
jgi:hypothetical protein